MIRATEIDLIPNESLSGSNSYKVFVDSAVDLVGNSLAESVTASFTTIDNIPPAPPTIEPDLPSVTSQISLTVAGTAEAGSKIEITGGTART